MRFPSAIASDSERGLAASFRRNIVAHEIRPLGQDDRPLELSGVAGAAPELRGQPAAPRLPCQVGENDRDAALPTCIPSGVQRGQVLGVEVGVGDRQRAESLPAQRPRDVGDDRRHRRGLVETVPGKPDANPARV